MSQSKDILEHIEEYIGGLSVPNFRINGDAEDFVFPEINDMISDEELSIYISKTGGYQAYLDTQLAVIEAKKQVIEATYEAAIGEAMYRVSEDYVKKPTKELLRAEALAKDERLERTRAYIVELEGIARRISGLRDGFKTAFLAASRIVTIRSQNNRESY